MVSRSPRDERGHEANRLRFCSRCQCRNHPVAILLDRVIYGAIEVTKVNAVTVARRQF